MFLSPEEESISIIYNYKVLYNILRYSNILLKDIYPFLVGKSNLFDGGDELIDGRIRHIESVGSGLDAETVLVWSE